MATGGLIAMMSSKASFLKISKSLGPEQTNHPNWEAGAPSKWMNGSWPSRWEDASPFPMWGEFWVALGAVAPTLIQLGKAKAQFGLLCPFASISEGQPRAVTKATTP